LTKPISQSLEVSITDENLENSETLDYTKIPGILDDKCGALDKESTLRPTIITVGETWERSVQKGLLSIPYNETLKIEDQERERNQAFDLLDSLSRSGSLVMEDACLHVVIASTHSFDKTLMNTIIQGNVNPIEKLESSTLIVATTIHGQSAEELLRPEAKPIVALYSPLLFEQEHERKVQKKSSKKRKDKK